MSSVDWLIVIPLWILASLSIWSVAHTVRQERKYRRDVDKANALLRAGQEMLRRFTTPSPTSRTRDGETLH